MLDRAVELTLFSGGTGGATANDGLRDEPGLNITAVVSVADSGRSSGKVRIEYGPHGAYLPPGDINKVLFALSKLPAAEKEVHYKTFFERYDKLDGFEGGERMEGHYLANLLFPVLTMQTKNPLTAIEIFRRMWKVEAKVLPSTLDDITLRAVLANGQEIVGETAIDTRNEFLEHPISRIYLKPSGKIYPELYKAIIKADLILLAPGDFYTSLMPCLEIEGVPEAICESKEKAQD